jgi:ketosteroid isomerase-like protein
VTLSALSSPVTLVCAIAVFIGAYYLGLRRPGVSNPKSNSRLVVFRKALLLVSLACVVVAVLLVVSTNSANHVGPPVSPAYASSAASSSAASANDNTAALRRLEAEFMKAAEEHGSAGYMSYYADDSVELPNGGPIIQGKFNIAKGMGFLDQKDNHLTWNPVGADISASGDLGYTYGTFEFSSKNKDGKITVERGKYTSIWKKQSDGSWKVVLDMGNTSPEAK